MTKHRLPAHWVAQDLDLWRNLDQINSQSSTFFGCAVPFSSSDLTEGDGRHCSGSGEFVKVPHGSMAPLIKLLVSFNSRIVAEDSAGSDIAPPIPVFLRSSAMENSLRFRI
jgi:hypothetical protein